MRKALVSFGRGWYEKLSVKMTTEERDALIDPSTPEERRSEVRDSIQGSSFRAASSEDSEAADGLVASNHDGYFSCATVVLPAGRGFVVHRGGWTRF